MPIAQALADALSHATPSGVVSAYLFGSHAEERAHSESDIDVAVLLRFRDFPTAKSRFDARLTLAAQLMATLKTNNLDLVVLNDVPPLFGRKIVTSGQRLYCSSAEEDHAFVRDVQLRAADLEPFLRRAQKTKLEALRTG